MLCGTSNSNRSAYATKNAIDSTPMSNRYWTGRFLKRTQRFAEALLLAVVTPKLCPFGDVLEAVDNSDALVGTKG